MSEDRRRPEQYASRRDEALQTWIGDAVIPYSRTLRDRLTRAGIDRSGIRKVGDLSVLPVLALADLGDGTEWVLEPTAESVAAHAGLSLRARLAVGDVLGTKDDLVRREIDAPFKPVSYVRTAGGLLVASTTADLERLARLGRRGLAIAGLRERDRIVLLGGATTTIASLQVLSGAWDAGVAILHTEVGDGSVLADVQPTVVAGSAEQVGVAVDAGLPSSVHTLVVWTDAPDPVAATSRFDGLGLHVSRWWSPAGTRAAWAQCPGGTGFHTWPTEEHLEIRAADGSSAGTGTVVWSAIGWRGSVWLRVDLGIGATIDTAVCPTCGRTTPRVVPVPSTAARAVAPAAAPVADPAPATAPAASSTVTTPAPAESVAAPPEVSEPAPPPTPDPPPTPQAVPSPEATPSPEAIAATTIEPPPAPAPAPAPAPEPAPAPAPEPDPADGLPPIAELETFGNDWIAATIADLAGVESALFVRRRGRPGILLVLGPDADPESIRAEIDSLVVASVRAISAARMARIRDHLGPVWMADEADVTASLRPPDTS